MDIYIYMDKVIWGKKIFIVYIKEQLNTFRSGGIQASNEHCCVRITFNLLIITIYTLWGIKKINILYIYIIIYNIYIYIYIYYIYIQPHPSKETHIRCKSPLISLCREVYRPYHRYCQPLAGHKTHAQPPKVSKEAFLPLTSTRVLLKAWCTIVVLYKNLTTRLRPVD